MAGGLVAPRTRPKQDGKLYLELRGSPGKENAHCALGC
jgi:hypothetical protein